MRHFIFVVNNKYLTMGTIHILKIIPEYFIEVENGNKSFELRKNDRGFEVGDLVIMEETKDGKPTGSKTAPRQITYIFKGGKYGLSDEYCIFESKPIGSLTKPQPVLPNLTLDDAEELSKKCDYMFDAIETPDNEINTGDAAAFFLEGYYFAKSAINDLMK